MLKRRTLVILLLFSIVLQLLHNVESESQNFDLLLFVQHWPVSVCVEHNDIKVSNRKCVLPDQIEWTIHGIWPTRYHGMGPSFCDKTLYFNESVLYPILPQLEVKWKDHLVGQSRFTFWKHEWDSHGTCAIDIPELNTQLKYFEKALNLQKEYDMNRVLAKAGILPGQNYAIQDIINGVQKILGKTVQIRCIKNPSVQKSYMTDIKICLDKSFKLIDCNGIFNFPTNCDYNMPVTYPGTTSTSQFNGIFSIWQMKNQILLLLFGYIFYIAVLQRIENM